MHKVGMRLFYIHIIIQNMKILILNQNVIIYIMLSYFFVSVPLTAQTSSEFFSRLKYGESCQIQQSRHHDSGGHFLKSTFKNGWKKNSNIFETKLKLQVRLSIPSLHRLHFLWYKNLNFFEKKNQREEPEVVQCPLNNSVKVLNLKKLFHRCDTYHL